MISRAILSECGVNRDPAVYTCAVWEGLVLVVSLPASLGITHTVFLFASPPILLFGPGSFLLEWAIHAHSQILL